MLCSTGVCLAGEAEVRASYGEFISALFSGDVQKASYYVCDNLFDYYEEARRLALYGDTDTIEQESQVKILVVFQLRYLLSRQDLKNMTSGRDVYEWGVASGLVKKDVMKQFALNKIQINGDRAFASILKNGTPVKEFGFNFKNENGVWKIDMVKLLDQSTMALDKFRQNTGKSKVELALYLLERTYGKQVPSDILEGKFQRGHDF